MVRTSFEQKLSVCQMCIMVHFCFGCIFFPEAHGEDDFIIPDKSVVHYLHRTRTNVCIYAFARIYSETLPSKLFGYRFFIKWGN